MFCDPITADLTFVSCPAPVGSCLRDARMWAPLTSPAWQLSKQPHHVFPPKALWTPSHTTTCHPHSPPWIPGCPPDVTTQAMSDAQVANNHVWSTVVKWTMLNCYCHPRTIRTQKWSHPSAKTVPHRHVAHKMCILNDGWADEQHGQRLPDIVIQGLLNLVQIELPEI